MIREIDLSQYLPPFLLEYKELKKILEIESAHLQELENTHWQLIDNRFITSCDEVGIARFENMLGITPDDDDTLSDRIFRVLSTWNKETPYNYKYLYTQMVILCGEGNFTMSLNDMVLTIRLDLGSQKKYNMVLEVLDSIVPCAVLIDLDLLYNTHRTLSRFTHAHLASYTHAQLRSEVLT